MTKIEWTDTTWNPVTGCTRVSPGCEHCYAERMARRLDGRGIGYDGTTRGTSKGPRWGGKINLLPERLEEPLRWRKPRRVFVCSMSDLFHPDVPFEFIAAVFGVMAAAPAHTFQVLTKRPERMVEFFCDFLRTRTPDIRPRKNIGGGGCDLFVQRFATALLSCKSYPWPLPNVWLGTSVEDQQRADERIPHLLRCPAAVQFLSVEPLLGPVDLTCVDPWDDWYTDALDTPDPSFAIKWVIVGGESGPGARPMDIAWARSIVQQCREARVAVFVKQLGRHPFCDAGWAGPAPLHALDSERGSITDTKSGNPDEWPDDLRVREFPETGGRIGGGAAIGGVRRRKSKVEDE